MGGKKKYSIIIIMVITHVLVNFSLSSRLEIWVLSLGLGGSGLISWIHFLIHVIRVSYMRAVLMIMMYILVIRCVALPIIIMGAWSTAVLVLLGQRTEYNYSVTLLPLVLLIVNSASHNKQYNGNRDKH